ncbi:hypothetical protein [Pararhodobacter oceanensis]|uniref:hypothetical protein n=1 Tax=Pararhodobacter oceanensis TaxID=2172121 RepID=UPI003A9275BD
MTMKRAIAAFAFSMAIPQMAAAQTMTKDQICSALVPQLLEMVTSVSAIPSAFDTAMQTGFDTEARHSFAEVAAIGHELGTVAIRYRQAFLTVCYGE